MPVLLCVEYVGLGSFWLYNQLPVTTPFYQKNKNEHAHHAIIIIIMVDVVWSGCDITEKLLYTWAVQPLKK